MTIFDLVLVLAVLSSVVSLLSVAVLVFGGRSRSALRRLRTFGVCAATYLAVSIAVAAAKPQRVMLVGDPWCFDDWCLTVTNVRRVPGATQNSYDIDLLISSRARRISQRAKGAWIYLIDERGQRYAPQFDPSTVPLDVLLQPNQEVATRRRFQVPVQAHPLGLITGHGGPYCGPMQFLVIGSAGCLFGKPAMVSVP